MTPARAGTRSTGSWSGRRRRSWRCSTSGATWTGPIASSPTAAPTSNGCGRRRRRLIGCWPVTALPCKELHDRHGPPRRRGRSGASGARTSCGAGTAPSSNAAPPPSTRTRSSTSCPASGSRHTSPPTRTRSPPGSCSAAGSTTRDCSPTSSEPASPTPTPRSPTATRRRCCWRSRTTGPRWPPTRPAGSWHCARSPNTSAAHRPRPTRHGSSRCGATSNASTHTSRRSPNRPPSPPNLERARIHHNSVRLHEAIGYVTPNDEHHGRGDTIRAARTDGMRTADQQRRAWHRSQQ